MIKSVLVAALSVTLISTGIASPHKKSSGSHQKKSSHSSKQKSSSKHKSSSSKSTINRKATSKTYDRGRRYTESESPAPSIGRGTVTGANVNVRSRPDSSASVVTKVSGGDVAILAHQGDWYKLRFQHGTIGWVKDEFLKVASKTTTASKAKVTPIKLDPVPQAVLAKAESTDGLTRYVSVVGDSVNIRKGPSTSNSSAGKVSGGKAMVVDHWNDWYKLKFSGGTIGWVRKDFLSFPDNFDYKDGKHAPKVVAKPEPVVASKEPAKDKTEDVKKPVEAAKPADTKPTGPLPENTVEVSATGERTSIDPDPKTANATPDSGPAPVMVSLIGDGVNIRRGPSVTNSTITKVSGGQAEIIEEHKDWFKLKFSGGTVGWVSGDYVSFPGHERSMETDVVHGDKIKAMINEAKKFENARVRYNYGSANRSYTDCSGFVLQVFKSIGINMPRTAREQAQRGKKVGRWDLKVGDLVFFNTRGYISHVGIYIGNQKFVHASSGGGRVMESSLNETYYGNRFLFGKRIISQSEAKKLDLPTPGELDQEKDNQRDDSNPDPKVKDSNS
ncbi:MAG: SH3 domain-containing protein [Armatimonadetes bacterium]|nr:SH3 domain-containing protein [Armatimonadota bacterium]